MNDREKGSSLESIVREIKRQTRRKFSAEDKIRIALEGLRGEAGITDLCRKEGIHPTMYYKKMEIIRMVEESSLSVKQTLREMESVALYGQNYKMRIVY